MGYPFRIKLAISDYNFDKKEEKKYGFQKDGYYWTDKYLWEKSKDLPVEEVPVEQFLQTKIGWKLNNIFDICFNVTRINKADLDYPIILRSDGVPLDGYHRICKAILTKQETIKARRFIEDPPPEGEV